MIWAKKPLFHVHTFRCGHAENISDQMYVEKAITLGATDIWFTDHSLLPGDGYHGRMLVERLPEYLASLERLQKQYKSQIRVHTGLELEYLPKFNRNQATGNSWKEQSWYRALSEIPQIELLLLGQHFAEDLAEPTRDTHAWDKERLIEEECRVLADATIAGMESGYFGIVAHPDRIFRRKKTWTPEIEQIANQVINVAMRCGLPLEQNVSSMRHKYHYWSQF